MQKEVNSATTRAAEPVPASTAGPNRRRAPRMHIMLDLNSAKLSRHLIQAIVVLYASPVLSDNKEAILLTAKKKPSPFHLSSRRRLAQKTSAPPS